jgi:hypothetical protein
MTSDDDDPVMRRTATGLPGAACLKCGALAQNAANALGDKLIHPFAGCFSICVMCFHPQAFTEDLTKFRELTPEEAKSKPLQRALDAIKRAFATRPS